MSYVKRLNFWLAIFWYLAVESFPESWNAFKKHAQFLPKKLVRSMSTGCVVVLSDRQVVLARGF